MRVLYDNKVFDGQRIGGISRYFSILASELPKMGVDVAMGLLAILFVANIKVPKPGKIGGIVLIAIGALAVILFIVFAAVGILLYIACFGQSFKQAADVAVGQREVFGKLFDRHWFCCHRQIIQQLETIM